MSSANGKVNPVLLVVGAFVWFALCWVLPIVRLRDKETTANMKTVWSGWLIIAGMGPIFYGIYTTYKAQGNAASANTGGANANINANTAPTLPSNQAGATLPPPQKVNGFPGGAAT